MLRTRQWTGDCRDRKQLVGKLAFLLPGKAPWREKEKNLTPLSPSLLTWTERVLSGRAVAGHLTCVM